MVVALLVHAAPIAAQVALETRSSESAPAERDIPEPIEPLQLLPLDEALAREVDELIPQLASIDYLRREAATARLKAIGAASLAKLRDAYLATDDLEVRLRIEEITETTYLDHHVYSRKAFLGISLRTYDPTVVEGPPLPVNSPAVVLTQVIENTAASRAGLHVGDVIVESDGAPLSDVPSPKDVEQGVVQRFPVVRNFSLGIAAHRPGDVMTVKLLRGAELMEVDIELGFLPESMRQRSNVAAINEALIPAREAYAAWWMAYFSKSP